MKLPQKFSENMKRMLGDEFADYEEALSKPMYHALRVNTLKISVENFLKISPFELEPVPWCSNGFYYDEDRFTPSKHPYYYAGLYYLQEPSALLPAAALPIEEGDRVLDICAAPGGKSTELLAKLSRTGYLVSNDISASRAKALIKNLELFGAENVLVTCESTDKLREVFSNFFDKILIDAPCSGEGMFRKSSSMLTAWERNGNEYFANIQRSILDDAVKMLRSGGKLLYSTCTFSGLEDEDSIGYLLSLDKSLRLESVECFNGFVPGRAGWASDKYRDIDFSKTVHLFPHKVRGEGHFAALCSKGDEELTNDGLSGGREAFISDYSPKPFKPSDELLEFLKHIASTESSFDISRFERMDQRIYYIPEGCPENGRLHVLRRGILFGEEKKNRFEPSQALAMILNSSSFDNVLDLTPDDERVFRYLRGETIEYDEGTEGLKKGYALITVSGYSLGWGKAASGGIKNKYLPGWRLMS